MIITVVFDLDDTLYDEIDYCRSGFAAVAEFLSNLPKAASTQRIFDVLWKQFNAGNQKNTFNAALDELGISYDDNLIEELIKIYRNHVPKITLPTDSRDVLEQLSNRYTLALITDGFLPAQQLKVQALGIERYFKCIIYTDQLSPEQSGWKPSFAGFEKLLQSLNAKPETAAYIADNEKKDFIAPNKMGFLTIQIIRPNRLHTKTAPQADAVARYKIYEIRQLPALLVKVKNA